LRDVASAAGTYTFRECIRWAHVPLFVSIQQIVSLAGIQGALPPLVVDDVFITDELDRRAPKKTDYLQEKLALQDLAARMADQPEEVLPRFVDLALEITSGVSAGLSLYEEEPAPGVFRWQYPRGRRPV
jgi:hypothetical protein